MDSLVGRTVAPDLGSHWVSYTSCGSDGGKPLSNYDSARMNCCLASSAGIENTHGNHASEDKFAKY